MAFERLGAPARARSGDEKVASAGRPTVQTTASHASPQVAGLGHRLSAIAMHPNAAPLQFAWEDPDFAAVGDILMSPEEMDAAEEAEEAEKTEEEAEGASVPQTDEERASRAEAREKRETARTERADARAARTERVRGETTPLTEYSGVQCNCFAWALDLGNSFYNMGATLGDWEHSEGAAYDFVSKDDASATVLLWGVLDDDDEDQSEVRHASVRLTHAQLRARKRDYDELDLGALGDVADPFWSSALGSGLAIMAHPRDFWEGGQYGALIKGMKKK